MEEDIGASINIKLLKMSNEGTEKQSRLVAAAARRRRIEIRRLKEVARAGNPSPGPLSKRSRPALMSASNHEEENEETDRVSESDPDICTEDESNKEGGFDFMQDSESRLVPSSPSPLLDGAETLSVDSRMSSCNSEEEHDLRIETDVAFVSSGLSISSSSSRLLVGNISTNENLDVAQTGITHISDLQVIELKTAQLVILKDGLVSKIKEPESSVQSVSEELSIVVDVDLPRRHLLTSQAVSCVSNSTKTPPWAHISIAGKRPEMEDAVSAVPGFFFLPSTTLDSSPGAGFQRPTESSAMHFFGVYDGHGGAQASNYCKIRLHHALAEELESLYSKHRFNRHSPSKDWQDLWERALVRCFKKVDVEVGQEPMEGAGSACCAKPVAPETVGTTAVVAVVGSGHVIVANCGDSRAVLCRGRKPLPLSVDHKPQREDETARIEAAGGKVICWNGYRVLGVLAMSRAIGDSDGLWDVISNEEACEIARKRIARWHNSDQPSPSGKLPDNSMDPASQAAATHLCKLALQRGSSDNITVLVVDLKPKRRKGSRHGNGPPLGTNTHLPSF